MAVREHDEDTNIAFNLPDLIVKHKTPCGEYQLEAYKSTGNDQIIRDLRASTTPPPIIAQLQWVSVGQPMLFRTSVSHIPNKLTSRLCHFTDSVFYTHTQMLTNAHSELLAKAASKKYNVSVSAEQIVHLPLSTFECVITLNDAKNRVSHQLKGNVTEFETFPLRMDFSSASFDSIEYLQELQYSKEEHGLHFKCLMKTRGKLKKTNTLQITAHQLEELRLEDKLFGS